MPIQALLLLILAAGMHTAWNLQVKRAQNREIFTWWALLTGVLFFLPALALAPRLPAVVWGIAIISALVEGLYFITLTRAYHHGDFSLVYPLARGTAPALLALWSLLFLPASERPTPVGLAGLALLVVGLIVVGGPGLWRERAWQGPGVLFALATAVCISIYSALDGYAMRLVPAGDATLPYVYVTLLLGLTALFSGPALLARHGRAALQAEWRGNWRAIVVGGLLGIVTYSLVLTAYALAKVSYAGAIREMGVVFAALAGWRWLGESFGAWRTAGALLIFAGIVVIAAFG